MHIPNLVINKCWGLRTRQPLWVILCRLQEKGRKEIEEMEAGLLVAHFENIGFYVGSSYSKYRLFTGFSIKNIG